jgi:PEP-CTERM motif
MENFRHEPRRAGLNLTSARIIESGGIGGAGGPSRRSMTLPCLRQLMGAVAFVPILIAATGSSTAAPVFSINGNLTLDGITQSVSGSEPTGIADGRDDNIGITGAAVGGGFSALAQPGVLGSKSSVSAMAPGASIAGSTNAIADMALDNIEILAPGVAAGTQVNYSINFTVDGSITVSAFGASNGHAVVNLTYDTAPGTGTTIGSVTASTIPGDSGANGIFSAGVQNVHASTPIEAGFNDMDVFAEFTLATQASASAGPGTNEQGQASGDSEFLDTFSFPTDGSPVFNFFDPGTGLPVSGFTVDSSDGCIVDNRFVCGAAPTPPSNVPEPGSLPLLATSLIGAALLRRCSTMERATGRRRGHPTIAAEFASAGATVLRGHW